MCVCGGGGGGGGGGLFMDMSLSLEKGQFPDRMLRESDMYTHVILDENN